MPARKPLSGPCALDRALAVFASKWKPALLYHLYEHPRLRHGELRRLIPEVSQRVMTQQLREMERDGLVRREVFSEMPPRVEYAATALAHTVRPLFVAIEKWGTANMPDVEAARRQHQDTAESAL
ncbi:MAG: winged helix-turn-helix transcriptional regulator [Phycisphaerae bacterium]